VLAADWVGASSADEEFLDGRDLLGGHQRRIVPHPGELDEPRPGTALSHGGGDCRPQNVGLGTA